MVYTYVQKPSYNSKYNNISKHRSYKIKIIKKFFNSISVLKYLNLL